MGWLANLWATVSGSPATDLAIADNLTIPGTTFGGQAIAPDDCYIELYVESLRLEKARRFATTFNGVVYAFQTLAREGEASADLAAVSRPDKLAQLDSSSLGNVITVSRQMFGAVPWRGGTLHLELGLFSVKTGNLLSPVLDFVMQVSKTAGVSFIGAAAPFVPLLTKGMDLIAGQVSDVALEVAFDADLDLTKTGTYAIIAKPKTAIDVSRLTIDQADHKLLLDGEPLECGYCVFSIRRTTQKADFGEIPELKEKFAGLLSAIRSGKKDGADDALAAFRFAAIASPDLIPADADTLVEKAQSLYDRAFGVKAAPRVLAAGEGLTGALKGTLSSDAEETAEGDEMGKVERMADLRIYG